jgi:hypothetical protein
MKVVVRRRKRRIFVGSRTEWTSNPEKARIFQHCSDAVDFCLKQADPRLEVSDDLWGWLEPAE